jgi:hypothetical protein
MTSHRLRGKPALAIKPPETDGQAAPESILDKFKTKPAGYTVRDDGKRIELDELVPKRPARKKRELFKTHFTRLPEFWRTELEKLKSATTWHLAHRILREAHIQKHTHHPEPVVLSKKMTGLARTSRCRAANNMVRQGLIRVKQDGYHAAIVTELLLGDGETLRLQEA